MGWGTSHLQIGFADVRVKVRDCDFEAAVAFVGWVLLSIIAAVFPGAAELVAVIIFIVTVVCILGSVLLFSYVIIVVFYQLYISSSVHFQYSFLVLTIGWLPPVVGPHTAFIAEGSC